MKKALAEDLDSIVLDFRDRLNVKRDNTASFRSVKQQFESCTEQQPDKLAPMNDCQQPFRTFVCPSVDPLRTSDSYDKIGRAHV